MHNFKIDLFISIRLRKITHKHDDINHNVTILTVFFLNFTINTKFYTP